MNRVNKTGQLRSSYLLVPTMVMCLNALGCTEKLLRSMSNLMMMIYLQHISPYCEFGIVRE